MDLISRPESYIELILTVKGEDLEIAEMVLIELGAMGTSMLEPPGRQNLQDGSSSRPEVDHSAQEVVGYFERGSEPADEAVRLTWRSCGGAAAAEKTAAPTITRREQPWRDWVSERRAAWEPFRVSPGLMIAPPWNIPDEIDGDLLVLNPGEAFGLGGHPTTRGCLNLIPDRRAQRSLAPALDIGTGTGVLALRAAQCGYAPVYAHDNDAPAVSAAKGNLIRNHLDPGVTLFLGETTAIAPESRFALIMANIFLNPLLALAGELAERLGDDGVLIVSGIRDSDAPELLAALCAQGLRLDAEEHADGWAALRLISI